MGLTAIVLGAAAGGGFPQWNCNCDVCRLAWAGDPRVRARTQASLAVSADGQRWTLLNASPDLRAQIQADPALHPRGTRGSPIEAVVLTGAEIDQTAGLLSLRERSPFTIYGHGGDARCRRRTIRCSVRWPPMWFRAARLSPGQRVRARPAACRPNCSWCRARCRSISKVRIRRPRRKARPMSASRSPTATRASPTCPARRR